MSEENEVIKNIDEDKKTKKKKEKKVKNVDPINVKFSEKFALRVKKIILADTFRTVLTVLTLLICYIAINSWASQADLFKIDVTQNKIYTVTEASKKALEKLDNEVKIYAYGFEEESTFEDLLKQYNKINSKITYELLTEESNYELVKKYDLSEGYYVLIIQSGDSEKVIDASTAFVSYDYTTYQTIDTTEQTITNSILGLSSEHKPKVYITQGHGEYDSTVIGRLTAQLGNEAFEYEFINLATAGSVPDTCDVLAIISPAEDLLDGEVAAITDYINKGGEIFFSMDVISETVELPNLQKVLDLYGVNVENGYVFEFATNQYLSNYNYIYMPQVSSTSDITKDIYTDSFLWLVFTGRLNYKSDAELEALNVTKETLVSSSKESVFITDLSSEVTDAVENVIAKGTRAESEVASLVTKKVTLPDGKEEESNLVIIASGSFIADYVVSEINQTYPLSFLGSNIDFVMNSMAFLGGKEDILTIRKEYNASTYAPTNTQHYVVLAIIILVPILIILAGIFVSLWRKRRK